MKSDIPRRIDLRRFSAAETAIYEAVQAVEDMPADLRLTAAVVLLQQAREKVADFVDACGEPTNWHGESAHDPRHHLNADEKRLWQKLKTEPNTREDWADLNALITAFRRRFLERHYRAAGVPREAPK